MREHVPPWRPGHKTLTKSQAPKYLVSIGVPADWSQRIMETARKYGYTAHPADDGILDVHFVGGLYKISLPEKKGSRKRPEYIAPTTSGQYTSANSTNERSTLANGRRTKMPRGKAQTEPAAPAADEDEPDYTGYADKAPTATMADFTEWLELEVYGDEYPGTAKEKAAFANGVRLGGTLRMEFQKSDFNIERREARKAERVAGNGADEDTPDEAPAAKPARGRAKAATASAGQSAAKPATRRGRGKAPAEAPF